MFIGNNFWLVTQEGHDINFLRIVLLLSRRIEGTIVWQCVIKKIKGHFIKLAQGKDHDVIEKSQCCIYSESVLSTWTHLRHIVLDSSKVIAEKLPVTFHDLIWPWGHEEGSLVAMLLLRVSSLLVSWCLRVFRKIFVQNTPLFNFLPLSNKFIKIDLTRGHRY